MRVCVTSNAVDCRSVALELVRSGPGHYEYGRWQEGTLKQIPVKGVVQPLRPEEISRLEDSRHIIEAIKIYATGDFHNLLLEEQTQPDTLIYKGKTFEIYSLADWDTHSKILAIRKEQ